MNKLLVSVLSGLLCFSAAALPRFAIVSDAESHARCRAEMEAYAAAVRADGYEVHIAARDWSSPEEVRDSLCVWYRDNDLAGVVFIGDIPVPMIRKAQHLTSAFKMDEVQFPMRDSSVPSDRFYDDFDLKFRFVGRDSVETRFFYYEMAPDSPQEITCDIFSGRICPSDHYRDRYAELSAYLKKMARLHGETNPLDHIVSYTGEGSFSDSMIAWKDESVTLEEQVPEAFRDIDGAKFYVFYQFPFMKEVVLGECARDEVDLVLFHCHGTPDRQWIQNQPPATMDDEYYARAKMLMRESVRRKVRSGETPQKAMAELTSRYGVDSTWVADTFDPQVIAADSLEDIKTGIVLDDVHRTRPNARMYIFDACYNGDFRENDCIASRYIFSEGNAAVGLGNTVNVLQDKASSTYLGLLTQGCTVGEWHRRTAILESHVIGDPTFRFTPASVPTRDRVVTRDEDLLETIRSGEGFMERLNALTLLKQTGDVDHYRAGLRAALEDPYEYTRRKAAYYLCRVGNPEDIPCLVKAYLEDINAKRIAFNIAHNSACFPDSSFLQAFDAAAKDFLVPERKDGRDEIVASLRLKSYAAEAVGRHGSDARGRSSMMNILRNNPYPELADDLIRLVKDVAEPLQMRVQAAEALGWYTAAWNRASIVAALEDYAPAETQLRDEVVRTIGRLKVYLR